MDRARTPFNVNRLAQVAAVAALKDMAHSQDCVARTIQERERVRTALHDLGYRPAPSRANFLFFDAREDASELASRLLSYGVIVKPWREPGFSDHIRVSIGSPRANDQFLSALSSRGKLHKNEPRFRTGARRLISIFTPSTTEYPFPFFAADNSRLYNGLALRLTSNF